MNLHGRPETYRQSFAPFGILELLRERPGNDDIDVPQVIASYIEQLLVYRLSEMFLKERAVSVGRVMSCQFKRQFHQPFSRHVNIQKGRA